MMTGIADFGGDALGFSFLGDGAVGARNDRNAEALGGALGLDLVAHDADMVGRRTDEGDVVGGQDVGKLGVFRQEAVTGMHGVGAGDLAGRDDLMDVQIAVTRRRRADADAFVGQPTCMASASAVEWTTTVWMPSSLAARSTRRAISPRLAIRIFWNISASDPALLDDDQRLAVFDGLTILERGSR